MSEPLDCLPVPCTSCPYVRSTPPGIWDRTEYERLREFSPEGGAVPPLAIFLCHQTHVLGRKTICRGWLSVEAESAAVRLLLIQKKVAPEQVWADVPTTLYASGKEAAAAGIAGVPKPSLAARRMMGRLGRKLGLRAKQ